MDDATAFLHELSHTKTGGNYSDPEYHFYDQRGVDAVSAVENKYRSWMGTPLRQDYAILAKNYMSRPVYQPTLAEQLSSPWR